MAAHKNASHNRHSRTTSTKGFGVAGRQTSHQAPARVTKSTGMSANNSKPAPVRRGLHSGHRNAAGDTI